MVVNLLRNALSNFVPHLMSLPEKSVSSPDAVRDLIQFVPISLYNVFCRLCPLLGKYTLCSMFNPQDDLRQIPGIVYFAYFAWKSEEP